MKHSIKDQLSRVNNDLMMVRNYVNDIQKELMKDTERSLKIDSIGVVRHGDINCILVLVAEMKTPIEPKEVTIETIPDFLRSSAVMALQFLVLDEDDSYYFTKPAVVRDQIINVLELDYNKTKANLNPAQKIIQLRDDMMDLDDLSLASCNHCGSNVLIDSQDGDYLCHTCGKQVHIVNGKIARLN